MSCSNCNNNKCQGDCGCNDKPLCTNNSPTNTECQQPTNQCTEYFDIQCIYYNGPTITELDIKQGDSMSEVLQKLILATLNSGCVQTGSPCYSPLNVAFSNITNNSIDINWDLVQNGIDYYVEYKEITSTTWLSNPAVNDPVNTDTIGGLLANTDYHIRVKADCGGTNICYSLTYLIKTIT